MFEKTATNSGNTSPDKQGRKGKTRSLVVANRLENRWSGNGNGKLIPMQIINISLKSRGEEKKELVIKLKTSKISEEILTDLPSFVKKFFY
jgi:hypothetical protein